MTDHPIVIIGSGSGGGGGGSGVAYSTGAGHKRLIDEIGEVVTRGKSNMGWSWPPPELQDIPLKEWDRCVLCRAKEGRDLSTPCPYRVEEVR